MKELSNQQIDQKKVEEWFDAFSNGRMAGTTYDAKLQLYKSIVLHINPTPWELGRKIIVKGGVTLYKDLVLKKWAKIRVLLTSIATDRTLRGCKICGMSVSVGNKCPKGHENQIGELRWVTCYAQEVVGDVLSSKVIIVTLPPNMSMSADTDIGKIVILVGVLKEDQTFNVGGVYVDQAEGEKAELPTVTEKTFEAPNGNGEPSVPATSIPNAPKPKTAEVSDEEMNKAREIAKKMSGVKTLTEEGRVKIFQGQFRDKATQIMAQLKKEGLIP